MSSPSLRVRSATADDASACVEIYRPYVADTAITFDDEPPTVQAMSAKIAAALVERAWLVLENDTGIIGYAYASQLNPRAAYRWAVETTVYMAQGRGGSGGGRALYSALLTRLAERGFRRAFAGITQPNDASNGLHAAFGFQPVGLYRRVGWKLGAWHDVQWWQADLVAPGDEIDPPPEITP